MFGRLRMSAAQCEKMYADMSASIIQPPLKRLSLVSRGADLLQIKGKFDEQALEAGIKAAVLASDGQADSLFIDLRPGSCKVQVFWSNCS
jgi:hypothetical protein